MCGTTAAGFVVGELVFQVGWPKWVRRGTERRPAPNGYPAKLLTPTSALHPQHSIGIGEGVRASGPKPSPRSAQCRPEAGRYRSVPRYSSSERSFQCP
jgi:hypothetical protein